METLVVLIFAIPFSGWAMWVSLRDRSKDHEPK